MIFPLAAEYAVTELPTVKLTGSDNGWRRAGD
jgi:hypothetical protein